MDPNRSNIRLSGPERPNIRVMAVNLTKTAKDVINGALSGSAILAVEEKSNSRLEICNSCEFLIKEQTRCSKCGCFMKTKVRLETASCPIQKW